MEWQYSLGTQWYIIQSLMLCLLYLYPGSQFSKHFIIFTLVQLAQLLFWLEVFQSVHERIIPSPTTFRWRCQRVKQRPSICKTRVLSESIFLSTWQLHTRVSCLPPCLCYYKIWKVLICPVSDLGNCQKFQVPLFWVKWLVIKQTKSCSSK